MNKAPLIENLLELIEKNQFQKINKLLISNYKKSSAEGSCLNLKNTAELPLDLKICGNMKQDTREGYNKLNLKNSLTINGLTITNNQDGTITIDGTPNQGTQFNLSKEKLNLELNTDYIVSIKHISGTATLLSGSLFVLYYEKPTTTNGLVFKNGNETPTFQISNTPDRAPYLWFGFASSSGASATFNNYRISIQIEKGKKVSPFEQFGAMPSLDYPSEVEGVTGNVENMIQNKNYFDISIMEQGRLNWETGLPADSDDTRIRTKTYIPLKAGVWKLFFSGLNQIAVYRFDSKKQIYEEDKFQNWLETQNKIIELKEDGYITCTFSKTNLSKISISDLVNPILYSQEQNFQLYLGNRSLYGDNEIRDYFEIKIDEELYKFTGYKKITELKLVRSWRKYVFNGEEAFKKDTINNLFITEVIKGKVYNDLTVRIIYSNFLLGISNNSWKSVRNSGRDDFLFVAAGGYLYINCLKYSDVDTLKTKLQELNTAGNPLYVIYRLANPEEELITDAKLMEDFENLINNAQSYTEETNVSSDAFLKIDFYKDKVLELEERIANLENK